MFISSINSNLRISVNGAYSEKVDFEKGVNVWANEYAPEEQRGLAAARIKNAYSNEEEFLDLSGLGLTDLPIQIGKLASLSKLSLVDNKLKDAAVFSGLTQLAELDLNFNEITNITALASLTKLAQLGLRNNQITDITALSSLTQLVKLNLNFNQITDIAALSGLTNLSWLGLGNNNITNITALSSLTQLSVLIINSNNITNITALSRLTNLSKLELQCNQITDIVALSSLTQLSKLNLNANQITAITALSGLINLTLLFLRANQLTSIPDSLLRLSSDCEIDLEDNRFSEAVIGQMHATVNASDYTGPQINFSMTSAADQGCKAEPLADVVASWYEDSTPNTSFVFSRADWEVIDKEKSAKDFSIFLQRLHSTVNSTQLAFRAKVLDWLKRLESDKELRHEIFLEAKEGLGSCEDRISLTFNAMKQRELTLNVERGHYDSNLEELVSHARQAFRFHELAKMAYEKVQSLRFVDEVEVYFAYLVKTHRDLSLDIDTPEMRFFGVAHVTEDDVQVAILGVKQNENDQFLNYLANEWTPWFAVLKRLSPEADKQLDDTIYAAKEKAFENQQAAFSTNTSATDVSHLQLTREALDEIAASHKREFTQAFLQERGLGAALNPMW